MSEPKQEVLKNERLEDVMKDLEYKVNPKSIEESVSKLKIAIIGSSRSEVFTVVEKTDSNMTLKGKFGGYYYFIKK